MKTFDIVIQDQEFIDKFCDEGNFLYIFKDDSGLSINKDVISKVFFNCAQDPDDFYAIKSENGYYINWKFVKKEIHKDKDPEYYV